MLKRFFILLLLAISLNAQTLRPNYWLDDDIRFYHYRGLLWQFSPLERPYSAQLLQETVLNTWASGPAQHLLQKLPSIDSHEQILGWAILDNALQQTQEKAWLHSIQRASVGGKLHPNVNLFTIFYIDNRLDEDSTYIGKRQSGFAAFMEQAYLGIDYKSFQLKFGRDYLVWGPGRDASLMISANSRPMDQLYLAWQNRWIKFSYFAATLDKTEHEVKNQPSVQNRYLSGHRLELRPLKHLSLGISETALFGGPDAGLDFALLNPVTFYTGVQHNGPQIANVMAAADVMWMPLPLLTVYGSVLIDDIQLEDENIDDKGEPAEYGLLAGVNWADPLNIAGLDCFAEYTRVTNRTYNGQGGPWEKYLHRNDPIGHFLGNDFDRWLAGFEYRPVPQWRSRLEFDKRRRGEGRVHNPFDAPWRDIPPGETYSESFPTGVVESSNTIRFLTRWQPLWWLYGSFGVSYSDVKHVENQLNVHDTYWDVLLSLSIEFLGTTSIK